MEEDKYAKKLLDKCKDIHYGLQYYMDRVNELENELEATKIMYENRVNEYLKLKSMIEHIANLNINNKPHEAQEKIRAYLIKEK